MNKDVKNTTIIYITTNSEDEKLEIKIRKMLRENCNNLPIISVSRKPIKLGKNICVGKVPVCHSTMLKMLLKGLQKAKTEFALIAEADCLYPSEYFTFTPSSNDVFCYFSNTWSLGDRYWKKRYLDGAQICNRKHWIEIIKANLKGQVGWKEIPISPISTTTDYTSWTSLNPVVKIITNNSSGKFFNIYRHVRPQNWLPFWGSSVELKTKLGI